MFTATGVFTEVLGQHVIANSSSGKAQAGVDFNNSLIFWLRGSRNLVLPRTRHYAEASDEAVLGVCSGLRLI